MPELTATVPLTKLSEEEDLFGDPRTGSANGFALWEGFVGGTVAVISGIGVRI